MVSGNTKPQGSENDVPREWRGMILSLAQSFHDIRTELYEDCAIAMTDFSHSSEGERTPKLHADDEHGIMVKAFQVILASLFIIRKKRLTPEQERRFSILLWEEVLGDDLADGLLQGRMLFDPEGRSPRLFDLFCRIGEEITGETDPAHGMFLLSHFGSSFMERCYSSIIKTFSDKGAEQTLQAEMLVVHNHIDFISKRFDEEVRYLGAELN